LAHRRQPVAAELDDPGLLHLRLELLVHSIAWPNLPAELPTLITAVADRPLLAHHTASLLGTRLSWTHPQWTPALLEQPAHSLVQGDSLMEGLLAWTLIGEAGRRTNWSPAWRDLLVALRNHSQPDVRQLALDLITSPEA